MEVHRKNPLRVFSGPGVRTAARRSGPGPHGPKERMRAAEGVADATSRRLGARYGQSQRMDRRPVARKLVRFAGQVRWGAQRFDRRPADVNPGPAGPHEACPETSRSSLIFALNSRARGGPLPPRRGPARFRTGPDSGRLRRRASDTPSISRSGPPAIPVFRRPLGFARLPVPVCGARGGHRGGRGPGFGSRRLGRWVGTGEQGPRRSPGGEDPAAGKAAQVLAQARAPGSGFVARMSVPVGAREFAWPSVWSMMGDLRPRHTVPGSEYRR